MRESVEYTTLILAFPQAPFSVTLTLKLVSMDFYSIRFHLVPSGSHFEGLTTAVDDGICYLLQVNRHMPYHYRDLPKTN